MHLAIVSDDIIQSRVLTGVAERRGWEVSYVPSSALESLGQLGTSADAVVIDVESVDRALRKRLTTLAARIGSSRLFLLAEQVTGVLPAPQSLGVQMLQLKPLHPTDFIRLVEASVPRGSRRRRVLAS